VAASVAAVAGSTSFKTSAALANGTSAASLAFR
jgi:hypothetical protein